MVYGGVPNSLKQGESTLADADQLTRLHREAGNGTAIWKTLEEPPFKCSCDPTEYAFEDNFPEVELVLVCNDGDVVPPSLEEAERHYKESVMISGWNSLYATMRISCK